jgi:hypothetical protein
MVTFPVEFICPECGIKWIEQQEPNDEWFKLGTKQTLCRTCGEKAVREALRRLEHEILSSGSSSDERSRDKKTDEYFRRSFG